MDAKAHFVKKKCRGKPVRDSVWILSGWVAGRCELRGSFMWWAFGDRGPVDVEALAFDNAVGIPKGALPRYFQLRPI
jgi:hypothetical protein